MRSIIILTIILIGSCSSREINLNPKMRLRTFEGPINLIDKHDELSSEIKLNFEVPFPDNLNTGKVKLEKSLILKNAYALALKTVYLLGFTRPPIDVSDFRTANCQAYKVKKMHLVCTNPDQPMVWVPKKSQLSLSEYYWTTRFHEDFLLDWTEKYGVYISFKSDSTSDLELLPEEGSSQEFNFKVSRISARPNLKFPFFYLKILEQRNPTIDLALAFSYIATKKTEGYLAPITQLSPDFEELKRKKILLIKNQEFEMIIGRVKELMKKNELNKFNLCPFNLNFCEYANQIDFKDEKKLNDYLYHQEARNHIWGLLLLAHSRIESPPINGETAKIQVTIDMKSIMSLYKIMPIKTYKQMIEN